jgi:hypothetical protein
MYNGIQKTVEAKKVLCDTTWPKSLLQCEHRTKNRKTGFILVIGFIEILVNVNYKYLQRYR